MASQLYENVEFDSHPIDLTFPSLKTVLEVLQIDEESLVCVYPYGSRLMGLKSASSGMWSSIGSKLIYNIIFNAFILEMRRKILEEERWEQNKFFANFCLNLPPLTVHILPVGYRLGYDSSR